MPKRKPNILLIVSDDHGYADRGVTGLHEDVHTPALDRLAAEGVSLSDGYVTAPICSPSRAGIMTGRYQQRWGSLWFDTAAFPDESVPTLAEELADSGYRTGYFGKVHYGSEKVGDRACPPNHGFETTLYGLAGQSFGRLNYLRHSAQAQSQYGPEAACAMAVQPLLEDQNPVDFDGFLTAELGRRAREFIAQPDERPFFCMLAFNAVHNFCWQLPPAELQRRGLPAFDDWRADGPTSYGDWYDDVIVPNLPNGRGYYLAQLELMDAEIGALLDQLDTLSKTEDTLVVYLTDNGGSTCNYGDNAPLKGTKYTLWEGGIRVPMLWRWPGSLPAGETCDALASALDLMPTLRSVAGSPSSSLTDGINLLPVLLGQEPAERTLHWECGFQFALRDQEWKLSWVAPGDQDVAALRSFEHAPLVEGMALYNLTEDIGEEVNRIDERPDVAARLLGRHENWLNDLAIPVDGALARTGVAPGPGPTMA